MAKFTNGFARVAKKEERPADNGDDHESNGHREALEYVDDPSSVARVALFLFAFLRLRLLRRALAPCADDDEAAPDA